MKVLGIDIGGSGVKGAIVNIKTGKLVSEKIRFSTPNPSKPKNTVSYTHLTLPTICSV